MVTKIKENTLDRIDYFRERFDQLGYGEGHFIFACHAAFPIALTSDLLYQIWVNFKEYSDQDQQTQSIDYLAVSDVLLSGLCRSTGQGVYEMDMPTRAYLIHQLETDPRFGPTRLEALATFLYQYTELVAKGIHPPAFVEAQRWAALSTLAPQLAAHELSQALAQQITTGKSQEILRMRNLLESYANQEKGLENLMHYTMGLKAAIFKMDNEVIREQFDQADAKILQIESGPVQPGESILQIPMPKELRKQVKVEQEAVLGPTEEALRRIEEVQKTNATELDLSRLKLQVLPDAVFDLKQLKKLDLFVNQISVLPERIGELTELEELLMSVNPITELPESLAKLQKLKVFKLDSGKLTAFPETLLQVKTLENISLENNQIDFLPQGAGQLENLRLLDLRGNVVANLPQSHFKATGQKIRDYFFPLEKVSNAPQKALILASDPTNQIQEEEEISTIERALNSTSEWELTISPATSTTELFQMCQRHRDQLKIIHLAAFALQLPREENDAGPPIDITPELLVKLIGPVPNCELVILNVCDTIEHAALLNKNGIPYVIGVEGKISDREAVENSIAFYQNYIRTKEIPAAFEATRDNFNLRFSTNANISQSNVQQTMAPPINIPESDFHWRLYHHLGPDIQVKNVYAFLVDVGKCHPDSKAPSLESPSHDVQVFQNYLTKTYTEVSNLKIETLSDEQATYRNVVDTFRKFLGQAQEEDAVLFYFSGHGATEAIPIELQPIAGDTTASTLVLYDSRLPGGFDLSSFELNVLIQELNQTCKNVTVILDCSHAGGFGFSSRPDGNLGENA